MTLVTYSQDCTINISGKISDHDTHRSLESVNIYIKEVQRGTVSDSAGHFSIENLCPGEYHLGISHIGCETQQYYVNLKQDTSLLIEMEHTSNVLDGITISGSSTDASTKNVNVINEQAIQDNAQESLAGLIEGIAGVSSIKNGSSIAKPIVHGLYGNRLTILNNGVTQSGQQWGADHSPEIDPLVANKLRVIKGASALEYSGSNLGSVVLIEPQKIKKEPHLHGKAQMFYETNGRTFGANIQLQQHKGDLAWKVNGTFKKGGDQKTPNYFLNNTGIQENNVALQLEKTFTDYWTADLYFSSFNTELGILRGSHIGNLTDLESAFQREVPFFTESEFSYTIEAPRQHVNHQLLKIHSQYFFNDNEHLDLTVAAQLNDRKEYDIRRGNRSDIPALDLSLYSFFGESKYQKEYANDLKINLGIQSTFTENTNNPVTGILPLIPDYRSVESGIYGIITKRRDRSFLELGIRYDHIYQNVPTISNTLPREIIRYTNRYNNLNGSIGITYNFSDHFALSANSGISTRNPGINELYSGGLHQGVSGIEEGDPNLDVERAIKSTLSIKGGSEESFLFELLGYYQSINNYIFLNPQIESRLTIRGAFPVFKYEQTDANIFGIDASMQYQLTNSLSTKWVYSYIRGRGKDNQFAVINLPSNDINASIVYQTNKNLTMGNTHIENLQIELINRYVFRQNNISPDQDFVLPPDAYNLLAFKTSANIKTKSFDSRWVFKVDNLLNVQYRDYLNRQRYFADEPGISISLGITIMI